MNDRLLDPSAAEIRRWGNAAVEAMVEYLGGLRTRPVYPKVRSDQLRHLLDFQLPEEPSSFEDVLSTFRDVLVPMSRHNGHPRMFGYVQSPGTAIAAIADLLASVLNANVTAWRSAPAAVEIERLTIGWIKEILGFGDQAAGLFVSGGSMANLTALAAARRAKSAEKLVTHGASSLRQPFRMYASTETHHSVTKAAVLLGLGRENVRGIAVDDHCRIRVDELIREITADLAAGYLPFCIVANAGTVVTGACDPLGDIAEVSRRFGLWTHVDASYGGFGIVAPSIRPLFDGIEEADSVALDAHKWLYLPVDCGVVVYRDAETARATYAHEADYTNIVEQDPDEAFAFWDYGPELSRRFRALKVWMTLKLVGLRQVRRAIEDNVACARYFRDLIDHSDDFEMTAPVQLSICCFRYVPSGINRSNELDAINQALLIALNRQGRSYLSNARVDGRFCLRACVMNYRTTKEDMDALLADLRDAAAHCGAPDHSVA